MRKKRCKACSKLFMPERQMQVVCTPRCGYEYASSTAGMKKLEAQKRKERRKEKLAAKPRSKWLKEAQASFNAYIRERDKDKPCISCGRYHQGQYHAGHYRTVGAHPELRFNEMNCHKQCAPCNNHLSGNIVEYRINLKERIGEECLAWIERHHKQVKLSVDDIKDIKAEYKEKLRQIKKETAA